LRFLRSGPEIVDETPARPNDNTSLDTPLWGHDANEEEYADAGEGVGIEGDLEVQNDECNRHCSLFVRVDACHSRVKLTII